MFNGYSVSIWEDERVLETNGEQCHRTVHLKLIKMVLFVLCVFYHNKKGGKNIQEGTQPRSQYS